MRKDLRVVKYSLANDELEFTEAVDQDLHRVFRGMRDNIFSSCKGKGMSHRDVQQKFVNHAVYYMQRWESKNLDGFEILHNRPANRPDSQSAGINHQG